MGGVEAPPDSLFGRLCVVLGDLWGRAPWEVAGAGEAGLLDLEGAHEGLVWAIGRGTDWRGFVDRERRARLRGIEGALREIERRIAGTEDPVERERLAAEAARLVS